MHIRFISTSFALLALVACIPGENNAQRDTSASQGTVRSAPAQTAEDGVTMKEGAMFQIQNGKMSPMEKDVTYEDGTTVTVDGTVALADGTMLKLPEGMMITVDGRLKMREGFVSVQEPPKSTISSSAGGAVSSSAR